MNNCILEILISDCSCSDLNQDTDYNILDVVILINIILENQISILNNRCNPICVKPIWDFT